MPVSRTFCSRREVHEQGVVSLVPVAVLASRFEVLSAQLVTSPTTWDHVVLSLVVLVELDSTIDTQERADIPPVEVVLGLENVWDVSLDDVTRPHVLIPGDPTELFKAPTTALAP